MKTDMFPGSYIKELIKETRESELTVFYQSLLWYRRLSSLQKMQKIIEMIEEEDDITPDLGHDSLHDYLSISWDRLASAKLNKDTAIKIVKLFSGYYTIIPDQPVEENSKENLFIARPFSSKEHKNKFEKFKQALGAAINEKQGKASLSRRMEDKGTDNGPKTMNNDEKVTKKNVIFSAAYTPKREIKINDILLAQPDFNSPNDQAFEYIIAHPNEKISSVDIKGLSKKLTLILADLGFKGKLKEMFFPNSSKSALYFNNPVTEQWLEQEEFKHLKNLDIKDTIDNIRFKKGIKIKKK